MKSTIKTILIIYDELKAKRTLCLSTFFGFCGIWVDQIESHRGKTAEKLQHGYDVVLNLWEEEKEIPQEKAWKYPVVLVDFRKSGIETSKESCADIINYCLDRILQTLEWQEDTDIRTMRKLSIIYQEESLRIYDYNGRYYFYDKEVSAQSYEHYMNAYRRLNGLESAEYNELRILYAKAYCIKCMNSLDSLLGNVLAYNVPKVVSTMVDAIKGEDCSPAYSFLMGQLVLTMESRAERFGANLFFEEALYQMKKSGYPLLGVAKIYYALGNYWEKVREQKDRAIEAYTDSYKNDDFSFRAIYKLARYETDADEAELLYRKILRILDTKEKENYLQPMEAEYVFKALSGLEELYIRRNNNAGVWECCNMIEKLYVENGQNNRFYSEFYGNSDGARRACELTMNRIQSRPARVKMNNYFNKKIGKADR